MLLIILLGVLVALCSAIWLLSSPLYWKRRGVPYLFPVPLFGSNLSVFRMSLADWYDKLYQNYPDEPFFGFHYFTRPMLLVKDISTIKDIFIKDFEYFTSNAFYSNQDHDPFAANVLFLHGQAWKELRQTLSVHFTPSKLRSLINYVENTMGKVDRHLKKSILDKQPVHIEKMTINAATDIIVQAIFAIESDCFTTEKSYFGDLSRRMFNTATNIRFILSFIQPKLIDLLRMNIFDKDVTDFLANILEDVIRYRKKHGIVKQDFLQAMIGMMKTDADTDRGKYFPDKTRVPEYNFKTVLAQALVLFAGGTESAAMTMAFFLYEVSLNQEIQDKCREEIMSVVDETGTEIGLEDIRKLTYLEACLKETMRKYPPFAILTRRCMKKYQFKDSNLNIDPGTLILIPIRSIQWDPRNYPNPEAFIPERHTDNKDKIAIDAFLPWGLGPRTCLGKNFANMEMFLVLSRLLRNYKFKISTKTDVPIKLCDYTLVGTPNPALWLDVESITLSK